MVKKENFTQIQISSAEELRNWLIKNHTSTKSFWLVTFKKSVTAKYVSRDEVLDELISFGWIDGMRRKLDDDRTMQLICQRKTHHWSLSYKNRAQKLINEGMMHDAGQKSIDSGKFRGLWNFMEDVDKLIIPDDLKSGLHSMNGAYDFFENINPSSKRFALRWLKLSKTKKTRSARIEKLTYLSAKGQKLPGS